MMVPGLAGKAASSFSSRASSSIAVSQCTRLAPIAV
jgi:hypothetical protein